ncbi:sulfur carrier protein ThiS [Sediminitomix flava]|uniref:Sulfur carrier protein ThiS n=1 Tax=Sediminitomix flava TaxID=379075 RepID=A0A315Z831_SEDFL|nr:sulfur carrier protein ThiS [Sediminitomix flava]PWJ41017.1 sulfur carrier protein ThiS [Sediminitomix flava]
MIVFINKEKKEVEQPSTLADLVSAQGIPTQGTAVAVNQQIVPKNNWSELQINENDQLTIIRATQGG